MNFTETVILNEKQKLEVIQLWNNEYPKELSLRNLVEFDQYLDKLSDKNHILLSDENETVKGWLIYFIRDNEQCFAMLVDSSLQGQGLGSRFLNLAKERNSELNGWVIDNDNEPKQNGENYSSPIGFYRKNGFEIRTDIQLKKKNINGIKVIWKSTKK
ncbi:GNAT family N-acetyltransferase [Galbibacter pacificus]|uniref:GNAT family N-acetyltransferase n=1 Tax=Galbibacter pacificus TaxID=2996052 RepID=A0ABT6FTT6_9FLAO|nr:GNAT family N-acetyltransferase [Galbibacter pacificus]MDG3583025.1 GNAT family N-acetyltransferase [Galbibacter pacificus]MDG3586506.1 GNAT family N-acetyltransferase [Galbibacter pacificus]